MDAADALLPLGIALGLGFLVGLQRERAASGIAGVRTFPLITVLGAVAALLAREGLDAWVVVAGFVGITALAVVGGVLGSPREPQPSGPSELGTPSAGTRDPGLTTEVAMILMYAIGAFVVYGPRPIAVALGGVIAVLLHLKSPLHAFTARIGQDEFRAIMRFVFISVVILPVLPNQTYGPFGVLNPFKVWMMVVLIVAIGLAGYVAHRLMGGRAGVVLAGVLGGLVSSTATTVSYARLAKLGAYRTVPTNDSASTSEIATDGIGGATFVIVTATAVSTLRVILLFAVAAPSHAIGAAGPLVAFAFATAIVSFVLYFVRRGARLAVPPMENPAELRPAIFFGILFAIMLVATAAAKQEFSTGGVYVVGGISGLVDLDAITLSTGQMVSANELAVSSAWRAIIIATMANLVFKFFVTAILGPRSLTLRVGVCFALLAAVGVALVIAWP